MDLYSNSDPCSRAALARYATIDSFVENIKKKSDKRMINVLEYNKKFPQRLFINISIMKLVENIMVDAWMVLS